jgi:hypothetical protein
MSDRVDAALDGVQKPARNAVLDRPATEPQVRQLCSRDDAMLRGSERGDRLIASRVRFDIYFMANRTCDAHAPIVASPASRITT